MRAIFLALVFSACATTSGPHPTNVAHVRADIWATMKSQPPERTIQAMGKTTPDRAVVYTRSKTGARQEETWVRDNGTWRLDHAVAVEGTVDSNTL